MEIPHELMHALGLEHTFYQNQFVTAGQNFAYKIFSTRNALHDDIIKKLNPNRYTGRLYILKRKCRDEKRGKVSYNKNSKFNFHF